MTEYYKFGIKNNQKIIYYCAHCDYLSIREIHMKTHIMTNKHLKRRNVSTQLDSIKLKQKYEEHVKKNNELQ